MDNSQIQDALEHCEFFKDLENNNIRTIANLCRIETFEAGEFVFQQGDFGDRVYIIVEGQVSLERSVDLGTRKGSAVIGMLGKGRVFGCWSTLLDEPHTLMCSAPCLKPTTVLMIKGVEIRRMMLENRELGFNILERLCFLLRDRIQSAYGAMEKI
jgi:CRP/FNR family cyclic AMP-dependent transcriptional regulator